MFCAQIDDVSKERVCTRDLLTKQRYESVGLAVFETPPETDAAPCRLGHSSEDCPAGFTCTQRFAHSSIPNATPTHCQRRRP